jgi:hypothetical protein
VLPGVSNEQNSVLRPNLFEKRLHLPGAGEAGFVEHIKVPGIRVSGVALHASAREKTLQGVGWNASIAELAGGSTCGSEALNGVSVRFCALADGLKSRRLAGSSKPLHAVDTIGRVEDLLDNSALGRI